MKLTIHGIRHHGCGSARSVRQALGALRPDVVLIEGPPEANELIPLAAHKKLAPPVAVLIYAPDDPRRAVYYPFAEFSPEWQAIKFALKTKIPVRFIDLPQSYQLLDAVPSINIDQQETDSLPDEQSEIRNPKSEIRTDPLQFAAEAAGFDDGEIWWENLVETRGAAVPGELFEGILELMTALREEAEKEESNAESERDELREAFMREEIRRAAREGFENIAVVCGAWHAPRLADPARFENDRERFARLPQTKLAATWIPYTYNRLATASGYGAGIASPEFYHQIWKNPRRIASHWLARVAALLREQDIEASSASVIEAVRLTESLAVMRGLSAVGLNELADAVRTVLCFGDDAPLRLIGEKLIVGERIGRVPPETPAVPLQRDLQSAQKRLRFPPEAAHKTVELDLRKPNDLERSQLLHRLNLLEVDWGRPQRTSGKGTFKESWWVGWRPDLEIGLIEASVWGNSIVSAATNKIRRTAAEAEELADLTALVERVLLADLPDAVDFLMIALEAKTAVSSDVPAMMDALPPLADVLRYGNVRKTDAGAVEKVVDGLVTRICIGLPNASAALDDEAAAAMLDRMIKTDGAISLLQDDELHDAWREVLRRLADAESLNGLVRGRAVRLLFDKRHFTADETARRINLALSTAVDPDAAAGWLEGFLRGSGLILLHNELLLKILDDWVKSLNEDVFIRILPLLRRTFATFHAPERRQIGGKIKSGIAAGNTGSADVDTEDFDRERAAMVLPLLARLLGAAEKTE
ncbi:MAG: hypothetical protein JSS81_22910 [Acidobacteria bacterium]|nr:hypothetical protein [Acidobacteriota bacterium]